MNRIRLGLLIIVLGVALLSFGCTDRSPDVTSVPEGEWASAGLYEVRLVRSSVSTKAPAFGPDSRAVPAVPDGSSFVTARIEVRNPVGGDEGVAMPSSEGAALTLTSAAGLTGTLLGVGLQRTDGPGKSDPHSSGTGEFMNTPLSTGGVVILEPQFSIGPNADELTLIYRPALDRDGSVRFGLN